MKWKTLYLFLFFCRILLFCNSCLGARRKLSFIWNTLFIILPYILPPYNRKKKWNKNKSWIFFFPSSRKCVLERGGGKMGGRWEKGEKTQSQPRQRAPSSSCVPSLFSYYPTPHTPSVISSFSRQTLSLSLFLSISIFWRNEHSRRWSERNGKDRSVNTIPTTAKFHCYVPLDVRFVFLVYLFVYFLLFRLLNSSSWKCLTNSFVCFIWFHPVDEFLNNCLIIKKNEFDQRAMTFL